MSSFYLVFLILLSHTSPTLDAAGKHTHPGFPQMVILEKHETEHTCKKSIKALDLTDEQKEALLCVRILKGDVNWIES